MTQSNSRNLPLLAVTLGDVAGIGPEITAKMLMGHEALRAKARLVVVGDAAVMANAVRGLGGDPSIVRTVARPADATNAPGTIEVVQAGPSLAHVKLGEISAEAGDGSVRFVTTACALARAGEVDAIVTAPLNKAAMHAAGQVAWPQNCWRMSSASRPSRWCCPPATCTCSMRPPTCRCARPSRT